MIKIIIVEDEYLIRERIKACIDWISLGCEIVGEGADGEEALELLKELSPDLAIVDINIPIIDGLSLSKIIQEIYRDVKILILTGFSSFEYAREALKCGVQNYLLKPINKEELRESILEIKDKIELERGLKKNLDRMKHSYRESDRLLKEKFIQDIVSNEYKTDDASFPKKLGIYCPGLEDKPLAAVSVAIDRLDEKLVKEKQLWSFAVLNIFDELLDACGPHTISCDRFGGILVLKNIGEEGLEPLYRCCINAKNSVSKYLKFTVTTGIGSIHRGISEAAQSYREALIAQKNKIILGRDNVILFDSLNTSDGKLILHNNISGLKQKLFIYLKASNYSGMSEKLDSIFNAAESEKYSFDSFSLIFSELIAVASEFAHEKGIGLAEILGADFSLESIAERMNSLAEIKIWMYDVFVRLCESADNTFKSRAKEIAENAKAFIESNYSNENLCLNDVANSVFLNASYLSNLFKKEAGMSVSEYIKECRMNKAKELIEKDFANIYSISGMVGFSDQHYFSKCFKKHFGVSPSRYIELKK